MLYPAELRGRLIIIFLGSVLPMIGGYFLIAARTTLATCSANFDEPSTL